MRELLFRGKNTGLRNKSFYEVVPIDDWDWKHDKSLTAMPGQLGGYEPTVNGKCRYRRLLIRLRPEWQEKQRRLAEARRLLIGAGFDPDEYEIDGEVSE
jgi:hypothetical protein